MANSKTFWNTFDHLISKGFPLDSLPREIIHGDVEYEIGLEVVMDSWGNTGNGWDDPGEAAEYHIDVESIEINPNRNDILPLSKAQLDFLEVFIGDDVQQYAAEFDYENYDYD